MTIVSINKRERDSYKVLMLRDNQISLYIASSYPLPYLQLLYLAFLDLSYGQLYFLVVNDS